MTLKGKSMVLIISKMPYEFTKIPSILVLCKNSINFLVFETSSSSIECLKFTKMRALHSCAAFMYSSMYSKLSFIKR